MQQDFFCCLISHGSRVTSCPSLPRTEGFFSGTFSAKTGKVPGKLGQICHLQAEFQGESRQVCIKNQEAPLLKSQSQNCQGRTWWPRPRHNGKKGQRYPKDKFNMKVYKLKLVNQSPQGLNQERDKRKQYFHLGDTVRNRNCPYLVLLGQIHHTFPSNEYFLKIYICLQDRQKDILF